MDKKRLYQETNYFKRDFFNNCTVKMFTNYYDHKFSNFRSRRGPLRKTLIICYSPEKNKQTSTFFNYSTIKVIPTAQFINNKVFQ